MQEIGFSPADILLPKQTDLSRWSVVACDQYTSEPEYWARVAKAVGDLPSTLHMILPEVYLERDDLPEQIAAVNREMQARLAQGFFEQCTDSYIYTERTISGGRVRRGLIGKIDLMQYDYTPGARPLVRPSEGTVESRLPPRVRVRENAPLELPHILLLIDDAQQTVIEPLAACTAQMPELYDFTLMENGGRLRGWQAAGERARIDAALAALLSQASAHSDTPLLYAVGDGNHSLATAKACFEQLRQTLPRAQWENHPARWALVELVNLHDPALEFEPIHRVLFGVRPEAVRKALADQLGVVTQPVSGQQITLIIGTKAESLYIPNPPSPLAAGSVQGFIDAYLAQHGGTVDYIHGDDVVRRLSQAPDAVGILLPAIDKFSLFPAVEQDGALPRKSFSMGHAHEKRFYLEARRIRP